MSVPTAEKLQNFTHGIDWRLPFLYFYFLSIDFSPNLYSLCLCLAMKVVPVARAGYRSKALGRNEGVILGT